MSFLEEPTYKPMCCGRESRWIVQSPTLHYFYCERCKDEVDPVKGGKDVQYHDDSSGKLFARKGWGAGEDFTNTESLEEFLGLDFPLPKPFPSVK